MISSNEKNHYDVIVIGSGMGGLATASILAQVGKKRVLMLERHFKLGGFTHSFRRKEYEWDVGVHYIGEMQLGSLTRGVMNLVTRNGVKWHPMSSPFEKFMFPEESFSVASDSKVFQSDLIERFPRNATRSFDISKMSEPCTFGRYVGLLPRHCLISWPSRCCTLVKTWSA